MNPFCVDHTELVRHQGIVLGKLEILGNGQTKIFEKLDIIETRVSSLTTKSAKDAADNDKEIAIEKTKIRPVFWALGSFLGAIILVLMDIIIRHLVK